MFQINFHQICWDANKWWTNDKYMTTEKMLKICYPLEGEEARQWLMEFQKAVKSLNCATFFKTMN